MCLLDLLKKRRRFKKYTRQMEECARVYDALVAMDQQRSNFALPRTPHTPASRTSQGKGTFPSVLIPPSPMMKKLGVGTGVSVYLLQRSPHQGDCSSPWAVKKVNRNYRHKSMANYRMEEEGRILKQLCHPNLIGYRGLEHLSDGNVALLMETGGTSLTDLIDARRDTSDPTPFPPRTILRLSLAICKGLRYLHAQGILHGDVKSGNILVKNEDWDAAKLCDLGTAVELDEKMRARSADAEYVGTAAWSPKEILNENLITDRADIYTLAMVMYEMLTLSVPHMAYVEDEEDEELDSFREEEKWRAKLGTRPQLPADVVNDDQYSKVVDVFLLCSEDDFQRRPSAEMLVPILEELASE